MVRAARTPKNTVNGRESGRNEEGGRPVKAWIEAVRELKGLGLVEYSRAAEDRQLDLWRNMTTADVPRGEATSR